MTRLHELPADHPLRNTPLSSIESVRMVCRHTKGKHDCKTIKIGRNTYNELGDTWTSNYDFVVEEQP